MQQNFSINHPLGSKG